MSGGETVIGSSKEIDGPEFETTQLRQPVTRSNEHL